MDVDGELDAPRPERRATVRWWAAAMAIVTVPFLPLLTGARTAVQGDNAEYHLPLWAWVWRRIGDGLTPFWGGFDFAGQNVAGTGQGAVWYPPNALFAWSDTVAAFRWWTMLHVWFAASGAFVWSWRRWGSRAGATVSAVVFGLNGVFVLHFVHTSFTIAMAWIPWCFLGLDALMERGGARRLAGVAIPIAMIAFSGHPQMLWAALVGIGVICMVQMSVRSAWPGTWARVAAGVLIGLGIAAVQLVPQYLFSRTSARPELSSDTALGSSATTTDLLTALFPWLKGGAGDLPAVGSDWLGSATYHEVGNHLGLAAVVLAAVGAVACRRDRRVLALFGLGLLGVVLAMAGNTPLGDVLFRVLPLADRFRIWPRYLVLANVAAACLAGLGTRVVLDAPAAWRRRVLVAGASAAGLVALLRLVTDVGGQLAGGLTFVVGVALPLATVVAVAWSMSPDLSRRTRGTVTLAAVAIPAVLFTLGAPWRTEALTPDEADAFFSMTEPPFPVLDADGGVDRWMTQHPDQRGVQTVTDTARVDSYDPLIQADFATVTGADYIGAFIDERMWEPPGHLADLLRVTTLVHNTEPVPADPSWVLVSAATKDAIPTWHRTPRLPEAWVVGGVEVDSIDGITTRLMQEDFDPAATVLLDDPSAAAASFGGRTADGPAGTVDGALAHDGTADFVVDADRDAVLLVSTAWLDGWEATVDGVAAPVARADGLVLAVPVPAGSSRVHLRFSPPGLAPAAAISLLSLVSIVVVGAWDAWRRRRRSDASATARD